ncbi:MAG: hypothetical protein WDN06_19390 [Asticcacaulis sp.]
MPIINAKSRDTSATAGIRGTTGEWTQDYSLTWGENNSTTRRSTASTPLMAPSSQTSFYDGQLKYDQAVFNADLSRPFDVGLSSPLTLAFGLESAPRNLQNRQGEVESYAQGPDTTKPAGAQASSASSPITPSTRSRDNVGVYVDAAATSPTSSRMTPPCVYENYSDFRLEHVGQAGPCATTLPRSFAVRGSVSSGFRAPSLAQQFFTSTASVVTAGQLVETAPSPPPARSPRPWAARPLQPEKSDSENPRRRFPQGSVRSDA